MPFIANHAKLNQLFAGLDQRFDLKKVAKRDLSGKNNRPEKSVLQILDQPFPKPPTNEDVAMKPPCRQPEDPPVLLLHEVPNPGKNKQSHRQQLRGEENECGLEVVHEHPVGSQRPPPVAVALEQRPCIEHGEGHRPSRGGEALEHHPDADPGRLAAHQAILRACVEDGLEEAERRPGDEDGQAPELDVTVGQRLPRKGGVLPGQYDGDLEDKDEHHPQPVEAAVDVPERPLLDEPCLPHLALLLAGIGRNGEEEVA